MAAAAEFWLCHRPFEETADAVRMVNQARAAVVCDTAAAASAAGFDRVRVFSTSALPRLPVERTDAACHLGEIIAAAARDAAGAVCYGGGGMPAMTAADWSDVRERISSGQCVSNRMFSCDWVGAPDGRMFAVAEGESVDNRFAHLLRDVAGLDVSIFPQSVRSLFDLDTPTDLAVLAACDEVQSLAIGRHVQSVLADWRSLLAPLIERVVNVSETMTVRGAELLIAGRVSGADWALVDRNTSCRVRALSEERGLQVRGGRARSLLGALYDAAGVDALVAAIAESGDAAIWDIRPFWSHVGWRLSRADRFHADLGLAEQISPEPSHRPARALTRALAQRQVLSGGHSLVAGGLRAAVDQAWTRRELNERMSVESCLVDASDGLG